MNEIEGFNIYCLQELDEGKNHSYYEEPKEEEYIEEKEKNVIRYEEKEITKKIKIKESTSKRLNSLPITYKTYDLDYKKEIIKEVNKYIY
jgi:hypothetical protein